MPTNVQMKRCIARERGALVFWSPDAAQRRPGARMQLLEVSSLLVATGYTRDPQGRLLEVHPSLAVRWSRHKQVLKVTRGELVSDQPVLLRKERQEASRKEVISIRKAMQQQGWRACNPCC